MKSKSPCGVILLSMLLFCSYGIGQTESSTKVYYADLSAERLSPTQKSEAVNTLRKWALDHSYKELFDKDAIESAITWTSNSSRYSPVFIHSLDPEKPESGFQLTVLDVKDYFRATLSAVLSGDLQQHTVQKALMEKEFESFRGAFQKITFLNSAEQDAAANP